MEALGGGQGLNGLAEAFHLSPEAATALLAQVLPQAVDRLTPDGTLPAGGRLGQAAGLLGGLR